jgi:hypothetical protein
VHGLLRAGFVPQAGIRRLQDYLRLRADHIASAGTSVPHMQRALQRMMERFSSTALDTLPLSSVTRARAILDSYHVLSGTDCEEPVGGSVDVGLQRLCCLAGANLPWGLTHRICNYGGDEDEAAKFWSENLERLGKAIFCRFAARFRARGGRLSRGSAGSAKRSLSSARQAGDRILVATAAKEIDVERLKRSP